MSFLHSPQKVSVFHETYCAHIERRDVHTEFVRNFLTYQNIISDDRTIYSHVPNQISGKSSNLTRSYLICRTKIMEMRGYVHIE